MRYFILISLSWMPLSLLAGGPEKNGEGFQTARQYTSELFSEKSSFGGKVLDKIDVADYTYVQFTQGQESQWLATSKTDVKKGDVISFANPQTMHKFHSKTLKRTFEEIYFVSSLNVMAPAK